MEENENCAKSNRKQKNIQRVKWKQRKEYEEMFWPRIFLDVVLSR